MFDNSKAPEAYETVMFDNGGVSEAYETMMFDNGGTSEAYGTAMFDNGEVSEAYKTMMFDNGGVSESYGTAPLSNIRFQSEIDVHPNQGAEALHGVAVVLFVFLTKDVVQLRIHAKGIVEGVAAGQIQFVDIVHIQDLI